MRVRVVMMMIVKFVKLSSSPLPPLSFFVPILLGQLPVFPLLPYPNFKLPRSDDPNSQVECDEQVTFEHPDYDVVVHGYEFFVSYNGGEEVIVVLLGERGGNSGEDP